MDDRPTLTDLAIQHQTDKWGSHYYTPHYEHHFKHLRDEPVNLLEIGVGGYQDPHAGGNSLRMWRDFFPRGRIYGIDICDKSPHDDDRIKTFQGSQVDAKFLARVADEIGRIDIVVDDGSHVNWHVVKTFEILYPLLSENGIYAVEDLQTSYFHDFGGHSFNLKRVKTAMNYFKHLTDSLNFMEFDNPLYHPTYFDEHTVAMHFYHSMVFIQKGANQEKSNMERIREMRHTARPLDVLKAGVKWLWAWKRLI